MCLSNAHFNRETTKTHHVRRIRNKSSVTVNNWNIYNADEDTSFECV